MSTGFPDYQDYPIWRAPVITPTTYSISPSSPAVVDVQLGSFSSLAVAYVGATAGSQFRVNYYSDATKSTLIGGYLWTVFTGITLNVLLPNLGNFAEILMQTTVAGTQSVSLAAQPCNTPTSKPVYPLGANAVNGPANVGASATLTFQLPAIMEGTGYAFLSPADATGKLSMRIYPTDQTGASLGRLAEIDSPTASVGIFFQVIGQPIRVDVVNSDAANPHNSNVHIQVLSP